MIIKSSKALIFGGMALAALAVAGQQGMNLRRELKQDSKDVYKIDTVVKMVANMGGTELDGDITAAQTYTMSTKSVDTAKGVADVESETVTDKFEVGGALGQMMTETPEIPKFNSKGKMDATGRFLASDNTLANPVMALLGDVQAALGNFWIVFPAKPVSVGDTWDVPIAKNPFLGNKETKLTAKLTGEKELDGVKVWVVSVTGQLKVDADMKEVGKFMGSTGGPIGDMLTKANATIKGTLDVENEGFVDKATGKTLSMTATAKNKSTINMPENGMTIETTGTATSKIKLAK